MIQIIYKCRCLDEEVQLECSSRPAKADVVEWVENVVGAVIALDHGARSPRCPSRTMEYVKIPVEDGDAGIGVSLAKN